MSKPDDTMRSLVTAAELSVQLCCDLCGHGLEAYARSKDVPGPGNGPWRCLPCGGSVSRDKRTRS